MLCSFWVDRFVDGAAPDTNIPSHFASGAIPDGDRSAGPSDQQLCRSGTVVGDSNPEGTAPRVTAAVFVPGADQDDVGQRGRAICSGNGTVGNHRTGSWVHCHLVG